MRNRWNVDYSLEAFRTDPYIRMREDRDRWKFIAIFEAAMVIGAALLLLFIL